MGVQRPTSRIQPGMASNGKKQPPIIIKGKRTREVSTLPARRLIARHWIRVKQRYSAVPASAHQGSPQARAAGDWSNASTAIRSPVSATADIIAAAASVFPPRKAQSGWGALTSRRSVPSSFSFQRSSLIPWAMKSRDIRTMPGRKNCAKSKGSSSPPPATSASSSSTGGNSTCSRPRRRRLTSAASSPMR